MTRARPIPDALLITSEHILEGKMVLETPCQDFDHYKRLPDVVSYHGRVCGKTGWNSDRNYACYKQTDYIARKVG